MGVCELQRNRCMYKEGEEGLCCGYLRVRTYQHGLACEAPLGYCNQQYQRNEDLLYRILHTNVIIIVNLVIIHEKRKRINCIEYERGKKG